MKKHLLWRPLLALAGLPLAGCASFPEPVETPPLAVTAAAPAPDGPAAQENPETGPAVSGGDGSLPAAAAGSSGPPPEPGDANGGAHGAAALLPERSTLVAPGFLLP